MMSFMFGVLVGGAAVWLGSWWADRHTTDYADYWFANSNKWMKAFFDLRHVGEEVNSDD